ncbi:MFS transporter [Streptomyces spiralis]|uniref:MFS transporter n=1 Tax=Streptomyces spiralis TaxID=66376 RepID=A0A918ZX63_9ACTN|nr:MFS transporter [Streptomyces spiralis]GHE72571.1 MFS transporter [Streptomyces spiralis]
MTDPRPAPGRGHPSLPRVAAFWLLGAIQLLLLAAASAPSPLYPVYQAHWGFSATTVTVVFSLYAIGLLLALTVVGALSDHIGRRPVLAVSLLVEAGAMAIFVVAGGVGSLLLARTLQGLATGAATGAISAGLVDLQPKHRPNMGALVNSVSSLLGLASGALGSGLLVQYAPAPTTLVFVLLGSVFLASVVCVTLMPETATLRSGALASLRPRVSVPHRVRPHFVAIAPGLVALWALGGFSLSLGPSLTADVLHVHDHLIAGVVIGMLTGTGAVGSLALHPREPRHAMAVGSLALATGMTLTLVGVSAAVPAAYLLGNAIAGFGWGAALLGSFRTVLPLAEARERAGVFSSLYVVGYLAFSLPAIAAGVISTRFGLHRTADGYATVLILLSVSAVALMFRGRRHPKA